MGASWCSPFVPAEASEDCDLHQKRGDDSREGGGTTVPGAAESRLRRWGLPGAHRSSQPRRRKTATSTRKGEMTPERAEARQFQERLSHAYGDGGFLVLTVRPSRMRACEDELQRRFRLERGSFDDLLLEALRKEAEALEIDWKVIEQADGSDPSSQNWHNLMHLVA